MPVKQAAAGGGQVLKNCKKAIEDGSLKGAVLLFGREDYLIKKARDAILDRFINPAVKELDFTRMDPKDLTLRALIEQCETLPIFSEKRVVLIPDFPPLFGKTLKGFGEKEQEELLAYLKTIPETTLLLFTAKTADKRTRLYKAIPTTYEFGPVEKDVLRKFTDRVLESFGKTIDDKAFSLLLDMTGYYPNPFHKTANREYEYTLYHLENDLKKLAGAATGNVLHQADVEALVENNLELDVFRILDAACEGRKGESLLQLRSLLKNGESYYRILGLLISQLEILVAVKEMDEDRFLLPTMVSTLGDAGYTEYRVKKAVPLADHFTLAGIHKVFAFALEVDHNIKTGVLEGPVALELLLAQI